MKKKPILYTVLAAVIGIAPAYAASPVGKTIWLYHDANGSYVTVDAGAGNWVAAKSTTSVGIAEKFIVKEAGGGNILLMAVINGNYCIVHTNDVDKIYADTTSTSDALAHFSWTDLPGGKVRLAVVGDDGDSNDNVSPSGAAQVLRANTSSTGVETEFTWGVVGAIGTIDSLSATVDDESVSLDWDDDVSGVLDFYRVYRSAESGTNYAQIASGLSESKYIDTGIPGGITYYYVVTAVDTNGTASPFSNEIAAVPNEVVWLQHLDATKSVSVMTASGVVTQWIDQTTSGNDAVPSAGNVLYPSASLSSSGLAGLDMQSSHNSLELFSAAGSDNWLDQSSSSNGFCVMVAFKCDVVRTGDSNDVIGNSVDGSTGFGMRYTGAGALQAWLGGKLISSAGPGVVKNGDTLIFALNYNAAAGTYDFWDSKNYTSATGSLAKADFSMGAPVTVGSAASSNRYFDGMVGEVKVFGSRLSPDHFERERVKLLNKWTRKPNIVMLLIDDWAWNGTPILMDDRMRNSAMPIAEMPHLVSLAAQGMRFRNAYGSVMCVPSRACLQTGQSSARHQMTVELGRTDYYDTTYPQFPVTPNGVQKGLPLTITTIPKALGPMGYKCANFGKWHLTSDPGEAGYVAHDGPNNNDPGQTIDSTTLDGITDPKRMGEITTKAMAFMEEQVGQGTPFYVQLSHYAMHEGRECFPATRAKYQNIPAIVAYNGGKTDPALINRKSDPAVWLGMADDLDGKIGQVLQKITDLGIADNTYVIMVSDNGYREDFFDEISGLFQPLHAHKWWAWQGGIRVAMVVKGPGIRANSLCTANVVNYDFLPTFVEWAGGDPSRLPDIDGTSLAGLFEGEPPGEAFLNRSLYFHYPHYRTTMPHSAIVKGQYKVVYFYETPVRFPAWDPVMLFDLKNDPGEYHNIAAEQPALAQALYSDLTNQLATAGGRIPLDNSADYDPAVYAAASEYNYRVANGPFIGTRTPQSDESPQIQTFSDYWMDSWGVDIGNDTNDYDHDGIANWVEYAMGSDPTDPSSIGTVPALENDGGTLTYRYAKRNDDSSLEYTVETTTNLMSGIWAPAGGREDVNETAGVLDEVIHSVPMDDPQSFIRLKISDE